MGCLKYVHDVAQTCDNGWCIAHGSASWFDYGFVGNIQCARMHVWFRIAIDSVHCVIARDVRDALDGNNVCVQCGIYGVLGKASTWSWLNCEVYMTVSMLCGNVVASKL